MRLKDFKAVFDRHGSYRFYFKTQDPDCGVVREEVSVWSGEGGGEYEKVTLMFFLIR